MAVAPGGAEALPSTMRFFPLMITPDTRPALPPRTASSALVLRMGEGLGAGRTRPVVELKGDTCRGIRRAFIVAEGPGAWRFLRLPLRPPALCCAARPDRWLEARALTAALRAVRSVGPLLALLDFRRFCLLLLRPFDLDRPRARGFPRLAGTVPSSSCTRLSWRVHPARTNHVSNAAGNGIWRHVRSSSLPVPQRRVPPSR